MGSQVHRKLGSEMRTLITLIILLMMMSTYPEYHGNPAESKLKLRTVESTLSLPTRKLIKQIRKCKDKEKRFRGYDARVYRELTGYLNSEWHIKYELGIVVTDVAAVKKRISSVRKVNNILYKRVKKLYKGRNMKTLEAFEYYIEDKITYRLSNPDMYKSMKYGTCVSYSTMLQVMCKIAKIPCRIYAGWSDPSNGHCWNRVKIKGKWFWCDLCWDDNTIYGDTSYLHQRKLWEDHWEYKPVSIYRVSLPY